MWKKEVIWRVLHFSASEFFAIFRIFPFVEERWLPKLNIFGKSHGFVQFAVNLQPNAFGCCLSDTTIKSLNDSFQTLWVRHIQLKITHQQQGTKVNIKNLPGNFQQCFVLRAPRGFRTDLFSPKTQQDFRETFFTKPLNHKRKSSKSSKLGASLLRSEFCKLKFVPKIYVFTWCRVQPLVSLHWPPFLPGLLKKYSKNFAEATVVLIFFSFVVFKIKTKKFLQVFWACTNMLASWVKLWSFTRDHDWFLSSEILKFGLPTERPLKIFGWRRKYQNRLQTLATRWFLRSRLFRV